MNLDLYSEGSVVCHNDLDGFISATSLYIQQPHLVNRSLRNSVTVIELENIDTEPYTHEDIVSKLNDFSLVEKQEIIDQIIIIFGNKQVKRWKNGILYVKKLIPRSINHSPIYKLIIQAEGFVRFITLLNGEEKDSTVFELMFCSGEIHLLAEKNSPKLRWLLEVLLPKLSKWSKVTNSNSTPSLGLIDSSKYAEKYNDLKVKYGISICKMWPGSSSQKFVYEDIGIATYLLLLWEKEREDLPSNKMQSFLDLGCGNGLLVYILTKEGHPGKGVDMRKRKTWNLFTECQLEESPIIPSSELVYPDVDWFIGNHSDELTPWIPVLAKLSSPQARVFLLPCCHYDFIGKYMRVDTRMSYYQEYQTYLEQLCKYLRFKVYGDRLKIPSTKRRCLVCFCASTEESEPELENRIIGLLTRKEVINLNSDGSWYYLGKIRDEDVTKARNCTQLDRSLTDNIVQDCFNCIISCPNYIDITIDNNTKSWNQGKPVHLKDIAMIFPYSILKEMKQQCGGIQTLLKNHGHIFKVYSGKVMLRGPSDKRESKLNNMTKKKICWFVLNHPQGCPFSSAECKFIHPND